MAIFSNNRNALLRKAKEKKNEGVRQGQLKNIHQMQEQEEVVIVEKAHLAKFFVQYILLFIKLLLICLIFVLAFAGAMALAYSITRNELFRILSEEFSQLRSMLLGKV